MARARRHRAARLCCEVTAGLAEASGGTPAFEGPAWNGRTVDLIRLAKAHCALVLHRTFAASVRRLADDVRRGPRGGTPIAHEEEFGLTVAPELRVGELGADLPLHSKAACQIGVTSKPL